MRPRRRRKRLDGVSRVLLLIILLTAAKGLMLAVQRVLLAEKLTQNGMMLLSMAEEGLLFGLPALLWRRKPSVRMGYLDQRPLCLLVALALGLALRGVVAPITAAWTQWLGTTETTIAAAQSPVALALQVASLAIVPALVEEWLFRGAVLSEMMDGAGRWTAFGLTTLLFALMHGSLAGLPAHLLVGAALTLLMMRTGTLMAPMAMHLSYNLSALVWQGMSPGWRSVCAAMLLALAAWAVWTMPKVTHQPMKRTNRYLAAVALVLMAAQYGMSMP